MSFLSVDGTLFVQLINFAIFFAVLNVAFLRPVAAAISKRRQYINSLASDYDSYQSQGRTLREEAQSIRNQARREAENRVAAARASASNEAADIATAYGQRAQTITSEAQRAAQAELDAARAGQGDAVARVAEFMLDRVIPEAGR